MSILGLDPSNRPAIIEASTGLVLTFSDLLREGQEICGALGASRQLLLVLSGNDTFTLLVYAGGLELGHPVALIDAHMSDAVLPRLLAAYRPNWIAGAKGTADRLAGVGVIPLQVVDCEGGELLQVEVEERRYHPDLALLLATSGTTGSSKFVRLSKNNLLSNARSISEFLKLTEEERPVTSLPVHYAFGLSVLNSHWSSGAPIVLTDLSVLQRPFWDAVNDHGCTSLAGVPYTYQLMERVGFRDMELRSLTTLQQAGGALEPKLTGLYADHMAERGGRMFVMYGQTEATARIAYVPAERLADKIGTAGIAIPGGRLEIDDETPLGDRRSGEVLYAGPNVMMGYATGHHDLAQGDVLGGTLRTGDVGYLDDEGFLHLVGRIKRITKVFGVRISLDDVEADLRAIGPAAVVGGDDVIWGFCAFGSDDDLSERARLLARLYRLHHSTLRLRRVEGIPTNSSGKTDYQRVQRWIP